MQATGIIRRIDDLGRVVIPREIRRNMGIREGDPLEIWTDRDGSVTFKKYDVSDPYTPIFKNAYKTLKEHNIEVAIYNYWGEKVAGSINAELLLDKDCLNACYADGHNRFVIYNSDRDIVAYIYVPGAVPNVDQKNKIDTVITMLRVACSEDY